MKKILIFITIIFIIWLLFFKENWTLMVCDGMINGSQCRDNTYVIPDFKSSKECMIEGASKFKNEGFECGKNCKERDGLKICKEICNSSGCR